MRAGQGGSKGPRTLRHRPAAAHRGKAPGGAGTEAAKESAEDRAATREAASAEAVAAAAKLRQAQHALLREASRQEARLVAWPAADRLRTESRALDRQSGWAVVSVLSCPGTRGTGTRLPRTPRT